MVRSFGDLQAIMPHHPEPLPVVPNGDTYWNLVKPEARQWDCSPDLLLIHVKQLHAYDEESLESPILGFLKFCLFWMLLWTVLCPPPTPIHMLNLQCGFIWRQGLWRYNKVKWGHKDGALFQYKWVFTTRERVLEISLSGCAQTRDHVRKYQEGGCLQAKKRRFIRTNLHSTMILDI